MSTRHAYLNTPVGRLTLVADGRNLTGVYFPNYRHMPGKGTLGPRVEVEADMLFTEVAAQLSDYFAGKRTSFDLPTATAGDEFSEQVWALLNKIPYGETVTYGDIAEELGDKGLSQRVGQAVGRNPISIVVPCHRVIGKNGALTGFGGGLERKVFLLDLEEPEESKAAKLF